MGALNKYPLNTHFDFVNMGSAGWGFRRKMALFPASFTLSVSALLLTLFRFFSKIFLSFNKDESSLMNNSCCSSPLSEESNQMVPSRIEPEAMPMKADSEIWESEDDSDFNDIDDRETPEPKFVFKFEYQTKEILGRSNKGNANGDSPVLDIASPAENEEYVFIPEKLSQFKEEPQVKSSSKYEFKAAETFSCFVEEAKVASFTVKEVHAGNSIGVSNSLEATVHEESPQDSADGESKEEEESEKKSVMEDPHSDEEQLGSQENDSAGEKVDSHEVNFLSEKHFVGSDSDTDSIGSSHVFSARSQAVGSPSYGFLSETDFGEGDELGALEGIDFENLDIGYEPDGFDEEDEDIMEQVRELEALPGNDHHSPSSSNPEGGSSKDEKPMDGSENSEKPNGQNSSANDSEDSNTLETLWEHQHLIEQLKLELKKVRATGLPTILEESESPNMDDLKPWKIDEKVHRGDKMGELHKFFKSYRERMRKFDILNYQKLYAIGFLQSKDSLQSFSRCTSSAPTVSSFWRCKRKKDSNSDSDSDPMVKFIRELHGDLEVVYVGQLCLSWEFLQWQYEKAFELWESDPYGIRSYNEVADEFQQFQVLMQRFVENERFQGPRVENYVKNRCVMRNLLQVPVIRGDNLKDKKKARRKGKDAYAITSDILVEILEESIRIIWRFIRADKNANSTIACRKTRQEELQDSDLKLLTEVQTDLLKKERKLKDTLRGGHCILKRFRKHEDEGTDHLYFFSQVDMKLVSRVLNMSSITTEQLVWCHNKLSKIHFVNRKIRVDPSFLLFPC
ncbi:unnamed protein product [Prunus armeniaca]|uniref:Ribosomal protein L34Ae n=1 Tax=Prunus armeniaca TaxID=36596 RepID=A0A6J5X3D4_PRUAR|nr:unnamed protein product [Prunus armeniaca]CAB4305418.1 unnamed protein product [Prunus armeniaca]